MGRNMENRRTYFAWRNARYRCNNPTNQDYPRYGGRGIKVCERWNDRKTGYAAFVADMGFKPNELLTLDRIDNDGNYEPDNCRWATRHQQSVNRSCVSKSEGLGIQKCPNGKYRAYFYTRPGHKQIQVHVGTFPTAEEARKARTLAIAKSGKHKPPNHHPTPIAGSTWNRG